ncbi:MAG: hypothetical protein IT380_12255 [Myxococcales bacterium]|nr:hypothetical protein [Myxococcales bacterium]
MSEKRQPAGARPGVSLARLLLLAAFAGVVAGLLLFKVRDDQPLDELEVAEAAAERAVPLGAPSESVDPMAPDPQSLRGIPPYPGAAPRKVMTQPTVQSVPMSVSWFQTQDSPDAVLSFYEKAFAAKSMLYTSHRYNHRLGYVAWLERLGGKDAGAAHGIMHMISASLEGSKTVVLLSASRPDLMMEARPKLPEGITLPEATEAPQVIQMGEGVGTREVVYARTLNKPPSEAVSFFDAQLKKGGWEVVEEATGGDQRALVGKRAGSTVVVNAQADGVHSNLILTFSRQPAPEAIR